MIESVESSEEHPVKEIKASNIIAALIEKFFMVVVIKVNISYKNKGADMYHAVTRFTTTYQSNDTATPVQAHCIHYLLGLMKW